MFCPLNQSAMLRRFLLASFLLSMFCAAFGYSCRLFIFRKTRARIAWLALSWLFQNLSILSQSYLNYLNFFLTSYYLSSTLLHNIRIAWLFLFFLIDWAYQATFRTLYDHLLIITRAPAANFHSTTTVTYGYVYRPRPAVAAAAASWFLQMDLEVYYVYYY